MGKWDYALVAAVTLQASLLAYLHARRGGRPWCCYPHPLHDGGAGRGPADRRHECLGAGAVVSLHARRSPAALPSAGADHSGDTGRGLGYCLLGAAAARLLPEGDRFFWFSVLLVAGLAVVALATFPQPEELGGRTELPPWIKLPAIAAVVLGLVLVKNWLQGFTTAFPMVGLIAAYERETVWARSAAPSPWP